MAEPIVSPDPNPAPAAPAQPAQPSVETVTVAQLHTAIEKARLEERTKLRADIDAAVARATQAEEKVKLAETEKNKAIADLATVKSSITDGALNVEKLMEQTARAVSSDWEKRFTELSTELNNEKTQRKQMSLEQRRTQLIQQNGGEANLIPELVRGTTEEELLASIEASKAAHKRTLELAGVTRTTTSAGNTTQVATQVQTVPIGNSAGAGSLPGTTKSAREMTREEYKANRDVLKRNAASRYPTSLVRQ